MSIGTKSRLCIIQEQRFMQIKLNFVCKILNNMVNFPELLQNMNSINYRVLNVFYTKHTVP